MHLMLKNQVDNCSSSLLRLSGNLANAARGAAGVQKLTPCSDSVSIIFNIFHIFAP